MQGLVGPIDDELSKIDAEGAHGLFAGLGRSTKLETLYLEVGNNNLGDQGAIVLGTSLANLTSLSSLTVDIFENEIGTLGAAGLGAGLQHLVNLTFLSITFGQQPRTNLGVRKATKEVSTFSCSTLSISVSALISGTAI